MIIKAKWVTTYNLISINGAELWRGEAASLREAVEAAVRCGANLSQANLGGANLGGANLGGANLRRANLSGANLSGANLGVSDLRDTNLWGANLRGANLRGSDLRGADLRGADLSGANLRDTNLWGANLRGSDLSGADLSGADLGGETYEQYITHVVPALCTAGGRTLAEVAAAWDCHEWNNCPMHIAFGIASAAEGPAPLRSRIEQFIMLFDARAIPRPS